MHMFLQVLDDKNEQVSGHGAVALKSPSHHHDSNAGTGELRANVGFGGCSQKGRDNSSAENSVTSLATIHERLMASLNSNLYQRKPSLQIVALMLDEVNQRLAQK